MKTFSFFILVALLPLASASLSQSQTRERQGIEDPPPGRPTLKRRQPTPISSATDDGNVDQKRLSKEKCEDEGPPTGSLGTQPVRTTFDGLHAFAEADVLKAFRERGIRLASTQMPDSQSLGKATELIKELLESRGYFNATVVVSENEDSRSISFIIQEGQRLPLAEVRFDGSRSITSLELAAKIGECESGYQETQSGYNSEIFDYCKRRLLNDIRSRGFLQATFGQPTKEIDSRGLVLTLHLDEGPLYRLGEIKIEGSKAVAVEQIRAMLKLERGQIAEGEFIGHWLFEDLKKVYGEMGYIQYMAEPEPKFRTSNDPNEGIVDLTVTIDEGPQFRIREIKFTGDTLPEKELLNVLRIRTGEVFNQRLFEESITSLNDLVWLQWIDKDRDVNFMTDEESGLVNIVIKISNLNGGPMLPHLSPDPR